MARPVTLFTGQWADLPLSVLAEKAAAWGYDGLELACWGDHFEVSRALSEDGYIQSRLDILAKHGLRCFAISNHWWGSASAIRLTSATRASCRRTSGAMASLRACASAPPKR